MLPELQKVQIHPAHHCNLRCIFCDVPTLNAGKRDLGEAKWLEIASDLCRLHPRIVTVSGGGEPFLRENLLLAALEMFHASRIGVELITNGTLISDPMARTVAECANHYRVNLPSTSRELDQFIRGSSKGLKLAVDGIDRIVHWRRVSGRNQPKIDIALVLTRFNMEEIDRMIALASSLGADMVSLRIVHKGGEQHRPTDGQLRDLGENLKRYEALACEKGVELRYDFVPEEIFAEPAGCGATNATGGEQNRPLCMLPFRELVVFSDGRVSPCCNFIYDYEKLFAIDSVRDKTPGEVWFGENFAALRECMLAGDTRRLPRRCAECSIDLRPIDLAYRSVKEMMASGRFLLR